MKKKYLIVIFAFLICISASVFLFCFDTIGLDIMEDKATVIDASSSWKTFAVVTDSGNCYLNGEASVKEPYGIKNIRKYHCAAPKHYVGIYENGDAKHITLSSAGGTIITEGNELYVFINCDSSYKLPTLFFRDCEDAYVCRNGIVFVLKTNGDLGYIDLNTDKIFRFIKNNIKKIKLTEESKNDALFVLTDDNKLYVIKSNSIEESFSDCFDDTIDFDVCGSSVIGRVTTDGICYVYMGGFDLNVKTIKESGGLKAGENVVSVTTYGSGVAMLNKNNDLSLYGDDMNGGSYLNYVRRFNGEVVFHNVQSAFGGDLGLLILYKNGLTERYGWLPNGYYRPINSN